MRYLVYIVITISLTAIGCKKTPAPEYETLAPLPYLPVYPGSSWTYTFNGQTIVKTTASEYELHSYESKTHEGRRTEPKFVPMWDGQPVYGYSSPIIFYDLQNLEESNDGLVQVPFLGDRLFDEFELSNADSLKNMRKVMSIEPYVIFEGIQYDDVIVVNDYHQFKYPANAEPILFKISYYAFNIGLIGYDDVQNAGKDTVPNIRLVSRNINFP